MTVAVWHAFCKLQGDVGKVVCMLGFVRLKTTLTTYLIWSLLCCAESFVVGLETVCLLLDANMKVTRLKNPKPCPCICGWYECRSAVQSARQTNTN